MDGGHGWEAADDKKEIKKQVIISKKMVLLDKKNIGCASDTYLFIFMGDFC